MTPPAVFFDVDISTLREAMVVWLYVVFLNGTLSADE
jgi:hypothetical protein